MAMWKTAVAIVLLPVIAGAAGPAAAQELLPPQPGLVVVYRHAANQGEAPPDNTFRVVAVDGLRSTAEVERATEPRERYTLHSYRVWYSERIVQPRGTLHQDSPTGIVDEFALLKPGLVRVFPAKLRYEADPAQPVLPNGQLNRSTVSDLDMTYAVERAERVGVPAGEFDTFVLARTQVFGAGGTVARRDVTRIWYAPELRWWVKIETSSSAAGAPLITGVAISIRRP
ncbi:MAG: hypothetical protein JNM29_09275 [Candidatus Odyssella sp.]|nr:hypothetical protein [Candidatus Odyssella sp.]